jgi:hypothetical protein
MINLFELSLTSMLDNFTSDTFRVEPSGCRVFCIRDTRNKLRFDDRSTLTPPNKQE